MIDYDCILVFHKKEEINIVLSKDYLRRHLQQFELFAYYRYLNGSGSFLTRVISSLKSFRLDNFGPESFVLFWTFLLLCPVKKFNMRCNMIKQQTSERGSR